MTDYLSIAREVAEEAGEMLASAGPARDIRTKSSDVDLVTEWDTRVEDLICARLRARTPEVGVLAEEGGGDDRTDGYRWLVDPIDGTVNFAHGVPLYSTVIALEYDGYPVVGVIRVPAMGWEFYCSAGGGAFLGDRRLEVSQVQTLRGAMLATGFPYDRSETRHNFRAWEHFQCVAGACRRFGAASIDLAMVAAGWIDGYWESRLHPWDLSAGALLVTEAGGRVTNTFGGEFRSTSGEAVASNGHIHESLVAELRKVID